MHRTAIRPLHQHILSHVTFEFINAVNSTSQILISSCTSPTRDKPNKRLPRIPGPIAQDGTSKSNLSTSHIPHTTLLTDHSPVQRGHTLPEAATESAREARKAFFCELCQKGYARMPEFEAHENSYDHQHRKRLKEMRNLTKDPSAAARQRAAEEKANAESGLKSVALGTITNNSTKGAAEGGGKKKPVFKSTLQSQNQTIVPGVGKKGEEHASSSAFPLLDGLADATSDDPKKKEFDPWDFPNGTPVPSREEIDRFLKETSEFLKNNSAHQRRKAREIEKVLKDHEAVFGHDASLSQA